MKLKLSVVYLVMYVLGVLAAGILTGIYGNDIGIWISYSFIAAYGIMILFNATMIEKVATIKFVSGDKKEELTSEQIKSLPGELGKGEENKVGETALHESDVPPEPPLGLEPLPEPVKEEPKKVQLSEEQLKMANNIISYVNENLKKGHKLDKIRAILEKAYTSEFIDFVLKNTVTKEPELPDMGEPEEIVTPKTLDAEIKENKEQHEATENIKSPKDKTKCPKCGKSFKTAGVLRNHMRLSKKCQSL